MSVIFYLQCDMRFNDLLLKQIGEKTVVEYTISKMQQVGNYTIISNLYDCQENTKLYELLVEKNVLVTKSKEDNVTKRFINTVINYDGYVVRVSGDQSLLDVDITKEIIKQIEAYDFYYDESLSNCVLPDVVSIDLIKKMKDSLYLADRYFHPLLSNNKIKRLKINVPPILHKCRVNDKLSFLIVKHIILEKLDIYRLSSELAIRLNNNNSNLYENGILLSWILGNTSREFFYDINGNISPWWCESAVNLVREKIEKLCNIRVFEWGAGNSTLFWSKYATEVISTEYDKEWCEKLLDVLPDNAKVNYYELEYDGEYCRSIVNEKGLFDIVLIDGRDRVRCSYHCISKLADNGVIIWDNSDRDYYKEGYEMLKGLGFKRLELSGILWGIPEVKDYTSIFYRDNNIFEL